MSAVLISTYWNVNIRAYFDEGMKKLVLISTYWNVNEKMIAFLTKALKF